MPLEREAARADSMSAIRSHFEPLRVFPAPTMLAQEHHSAVRFAHDCLWGAETLIMRVSWGLAMSGVSGAVAGVGLHRPIDDRFGPIPGVEV